jgi:hypothetical protein
MLAPSRNTTEQRYQTNALGLGSNPGSPSSLPKHPLTRQQESQSSLWTNNKPLPADEESWGGQLLCSPLTLTAREAGPTRFLSGFYGPQLWSNLSQRTQQRTPRNQLFKPSSALKNVSSTRQAEDASEPLQAAFSQVGHATKTRRSLRSGKASPDVFSSLSS